MTKPNNIDAPLVETCGVMNPGGVPCSKDKGHIGGHDLTAYGPMETGCNGSLTLDEAQGSDSISRSGLLNSREVE